VLRKENTRTYLRSTLHMKPALKSIGYVGCSFDSEDATYGLNKQISPCWGVPEISSSFGWVNVNSNTTNMARRSKSRGTP
jgi:hypothetical protein